MDLFRFFKNPFYNPQFSMPELRKYGAGQLAALVADPPSGLSAVIADLTTCLSNFDAAMPEVIGSRGVLAEAAANKKTFRDTLAPKISRIHGGIAGAYGNPSAELTGAFPGGRKIFGECEDVDLLGHLTALKNWFTPAHVTAVGATYQTQANGHVTQWTAFWNALQTAKGELQSDRGTRDEVKLAYQNCLFGVLLNLALKFPNDEAKFAQYVPQHLLEDAGSRPEKPVLEGHWDPEVTKIVLAFFADGATSYRVERSDDGGMTWNDYGAATSPAQYGDMAPGTYQYRVFAINDVGESDPSDAVEVVVP